MTAISHPGAQRAPSTPELGRGKQWFARWAPCPSRAPGRLLSRAWQGRVGPRSCIHASHTQHPNCFPPPGCLADIQRDSKQRERSRSQPQSLGFAPSQLSLHAACPGRDSKSLGRAKMGPRVYLLPGSTLQARTDSPAAAGDPAFRPGMPQRSRAWGGERGRAPQQEAGDPAGGGCRGFRAMPPAGSGAAGPGPGPGPPPAAPAEAVSGCRAPSCARWAAGPRGGGPGCPGPAAPAPPAGARPRCCPGVLSLRYRAPGAASQNVRQPGGKSNPLKEGETPL